MYNDQKPSGSVSLNHGHTKGERLKTEKKQRSCNIVSKNRVKMQSIKKKPALVFKVLKTKFMWCEIKKTYLLM